jgi:outer membrane protein OmpA-like peptidoglycan-associated protein
MSKKFSLFASVAAPLVSLPLLMQPAFAMPAASVPQANSVATAFDGRQPIILAQAAPDNEELPPKRQKGQDKGQDKAQEKGADKRQPQAEEQQRDRPARPSKAEQAPDAEPDQKPQRRAQPAEDAPAARQKPDQAGQPAKPEEAEPTAKPDRAAKPEQVKPEQAKPDRAAKPEQAKPDQAKPDQGTKAGTDRQQPRDNKGKPAANDTVEPTAPAVAPAARDTRQQPATDQKGTQQPRNAQDRDAAPDQTEDQQRQPGRDRPARAGTDGTTNDAQPSRDNANGNRNSDKVPPTNNRGVTTSEQPGTDTQNRRNQAGSDQNQQPLDGQQPGERPRRQANDAQQPGDDQPNRQPPVASTPQQVERAKELAKDPTSAKRGEQVTLPVENGAAVFDSDKRARDGDRPRRPRPEQQADDRPVAPPRSDADAQRSTRMSSEERTQFRQLNEARGERLDRRPTFDRPQGWDFDGQDQRTGSRDRDDGRVIISIDNQPVVRHDDSRRFYDRDGRQPEYDRLPDDRYREVIERPDGTRVVTIRNRYGEIVQRTRIVRGGEEYVLYEAPQLADRGRDRNYVWRDPGDDLPPMRLTVPLDRYIIDTTSQPDRDYYEFLEQPPVEPVERVYSLDEVRYSARIRDKVPRIDLDTVTFATGSAEIPMNQASSLRKVADAINQVLKKDPSETFLIEGHTDAVGSDQDNLVLSDQRAESVARVLSDAFNIPPENLTTQGYGEQYLKVRTDGPNQENRRVTIRRITSLVKPVASNQ